MFLLLYYVAMIFLKKALNLKKSVKYFLKFKIKQRRQRFTDIGLG